MTRSFIATLMILIMSAFHSIARNDEADIIGILSAVEESGGATNDSDNPSEALNFISDAFENVGFYDNSSAIRIDANGNYDGVLPGGRITSGYGYRAKFRRIHRGIDIAMQAGDTVRSVLPGIVVKVEYEPSGYGHYVAVSHPDGMETRYAHLSMPLVEVGQSVAEGEVIALSGNTGNSTGPHLHFETRFDGSPVDPRTVFDFTNPNSNLNTLKQLISLSSYCND